MENSIIKDVMLASGLSVETVAEKINDIFGWGQKTVQSWFLRYVYEPRVTKNGVLMTQVTFHKGRGKKPMSDWDAVFTATDCPEAQRDEIKAVVEFIKEESAKAKADGQELTVEYYENLYTDAYNRRAELAQKMLEDAALKAEAKAAKKAKKKVSDMTAEEFEASLGLNEVAETVNSAEEDLMQALQNM